MIRVLLAIEYATIKHGQTQRKHSKIPYMVHPLMVMRVFDEYVVQTGRYMDVREDMLCTLALHDTVEDTDATFEDITKCCGQAVADNVGWLTKLSKQRKSKASRAERHKMDLDYLAQAPNYVQAAKLVDRECNLWDFHNTPGESPHFLRDVYIPESREMADRLAPEDPQLRERVHAIATKLELSLSKTSTGVSNA